MFRCFAALLLALIASGGYAREEPRDPLPTVTISALPAEARDTLALIRAGGPYPHARDDTTFFNREGLLPKAPRGYYREYTVRTPGSRDRGPRRIIAGKRGEFYYTSDHYRTFMRIRE